ncbi:MAG: 50S ribosomal protein L24 [Verrucomicrobiota bacterium]
MSRATIKKNDNVTVIAGVDRGKTARVLEVTPDKDRALVEGVRLVKKTLRKTEDSPKGGITQKEAPVHISNLQIYCPDCKKGVRVKKERTEDGAQRKCVKCGHSFDK